MFVLDTDHLSELDRGSRLGNHLMSRLDGAATEIATTIVSIEEQLRGWLAQITRQRDARRQIISYDRLQRRLAFYLEWTVLPWDEPAAGRFEDLRRDGIRIGSMDLKIASIVLARNATLLTRNLSDFRKVPGLRTEDWL